MTPMIKKYYILLLCLVFTIPACKSTGKKFSPTSVIDMELFFKNGDKSSFKISPDGNYYSYRADFKGKMNIFVLKKGDTVAVRVTNDTLRSIFQYLWKGNRIVYLQDIGGDENFQLYSVLPDGSDLKALTPFPGRRSNLMDDLRFIPGKEKEILVTCNKRNPECFDPYSINIETGQMTLLYENTNNYESWYADNNGIIRMATKTDGVNITYLYRDSDKSKFTKLLTTTFKETFAPQSFDSANQHIYVLSNIGRDKTILVEFDPVANKEIKQLFSDPDYDLDGVFYDRRKKTIINVTWTADKPKVHYFDKEWESFQSDLDKHFNGYEADISTWDDEMNKGIITVWSDKLKVKYYFYDFKTKEASLASDPFPWLDENEMAEMRPITYQSRDGLVIHAYLTLPIGVEAKNLPVVINPHGGPWARDEWHFNSEVQFLANRGYAVMQMNYRGSTGYGKQFWEASFKEWGKKMQNDITDGVEYLKKEGIADSKRIAIYGGSYGGYATLAGITFTPDVYACAVDYVGVSNLFTFMKTIPPYWKPYLAQWHEMVGDPKKDSLLMAEASPALHVDKIKVPLFIAQGANDPRVNKAESDQVVAALKKRGVEVEYMVKNDEGHGFHNQDNQYDFYGAMEKFFDKYLKNKKG